MHIIRRSKNSSKGSAETYQWYQLDYKFSYLYKEFKKMPSDKKKAIIDAVIKNKCIEKKKSDGKASYIIMLEEIEKYVGPKGFHNRL